MPPHRDSRAFTVIVSILVLLGAAAIALVLALSGAPGVIVVGTALAALPVPVLLACYLWLDRYEPEPKGLLVLALAWGAFVATTAAAILQIGDSLLLERTEFASAVVVAPLSEEAFKGIFILLLLWFRRAEVDGVLDGIVYAGMVGIGFAFVENILYLMEAYIGDGSGPGGLTNAVVLFVIRGVMSPFAHPFFTAFIGIGVGLAVSRKGWIRWVAPVVGYLIAVGLHAAWNGSLMLEDLGVALGTYFFLMVPAFLLTVGFAIWARRAEGRLLLTALTDCANQGLLDPAEIPWLVRLGARRIWRDQAKVRGGRAARNAVHDYQDIAIELGFLHSRVLRGTPPSGYREIGQALVDELSRRRATVMWPTGVGG